MLTAGIALIAFAALVLAGVVALIVRGHLCTRGQADKRIADAQRERSDIATDRDGWRNYCTHTVRDAEKLRETNATLMQTVSELTSRLVAMKARNDALLSEQGQKNATGSP